MMLTSIGFIRIADGPGQKVMARIAPKPEEAALAAARTVASAIQHYLNNDLAVVVAQCEVLVQDGNLSPQARNRVERVLIRAQHAAAVIAEMTSPRGWQPDPTLSLSGVLSRSGGEPSAPAIAFSTSPPDCIEPAAFWRHWVTCSQCGSIPARACEEGQALRSSRQT